MAKILRNKPLLVLGSGAVAKKMINRAKARKRRKAKVGQTLAGVVAAGATGGAIKYFGDSVRGPRRRHKITKLVGRGKEEFEGNDDNRFKMQQSTPAEA